MLISNDVLERRCKDLIETILLSLENSTKGTIYRVGPMPTLQAIRVTSGVRDGTTGLIDWGLPEASDYNFPGKTWEQYRDRPGNVLEAMAWCVERQKSWTADNPYEDNRSVRKQLSGEIEDFHHMEPVLVLKSDLYWNQPSEPDYPLDCGGKPIWQDTKYVVAAVIKIHFKPYQIRRGDRSTKMIKLLSRTLGTELLSLHIRETLAEAQENLTRQRLQTCNVLAHELRNTLMKLGFTSSAINAEISYLREQWEAEIEKAFPGLETKKRVLKSLSNILEPRISLLNGFLGLADVSRQLLSVQHEMAIMPLMPEIATKWVLHKIRPKWQRLLLESSVWKADDSRVHELLDRLERVIPVGTDAALADRMTHLPRDLRESWQRLAYVDFTADKVTIVDEILQLLDHPALNIPHKLQTKKVLTSLRVLSAMMPDVEERANRMICSLKNGGHID
jgi:hypothetical protein